MTRDQSLTALRGGSARPILYLDVMALVLSETTGHTREYWTAAIGASCHGGRLYESMSDEAAVEMLEALREERAGVFRWLKEGAASMAAAPWNCREHLVDAGWGGDGSSVARATLGGGGRPLAGLSASPRYS